MESLKLCIKKRVGIEKAQADQFMAMLDAKLGLYQDAEEHCSMTFPDRMRAQECSKRIKVSVPCSDLWRRCRFQALTSTMGRDLSRSGHT